MSVIAKIVLWTLFILGIAILAFATVMVFFIIRPSNKWSLMDLRKRIEERGVPFDRYLKSCREALTIFSDYGYKIHGFLMMHRENTDKYVIVSHGYTGNRWEGLAYANIYYDLGYNVYLYDLRNHGENEETFCSMGFFEHMDIIAIAEELRSRYGEQIRIGLHGVSLGASSSIMALRVWNQFAFCVSDCGFADFKELMGHLAWKWFRLPPMMSVPICWMGWVILHFNFGQIIPKEALTVNQTTPVMFIHGKEDTFIPSSHAKELYDTAEAYKELHYIEGAKHAESVYKEPEQYRQLIENFLKHAVPS